jgi:uncharacterized protein YoxC
MQREFAKMNQTQIVTGANSVAIVVMLVFIIRSNLEMKNNLEEIRKEISDIKTNTNDNTKRSTLSLSRLSQRLEDQSQRIDSFVRAASSTYESKNINNSTATSFAAPMPEPQTYRSTPRDEVDMAIRTLMN